MCAWPSRPPTLPPEAVLLDRDGTLIENCPYLGDPARVVLLPGAVTGLARLRAHGSRLVVITNQSGVARGLITPEQVEAVHHRLNRLLAEGGVALDGIYWCPHDDPADCGCRKPGTELARRASSELGFELGRAVVIGDTAADLGMAERLGIPALLVRASPAAPPHDAARWPDVPVVATLDEAADRLVPGTPPA